MSNQENKIKRALISVSDKTGIVELAKLLEQHNIEILSTGGTRQKLKEASIKVVGVSSFTGEAEIMDGRVKTIHPKIAAGILYRRHVEADRQALTSRDYKQIDLVIVNLYPFEKTVARQASDAEIIENIDIGGPTLIRAAAKNFKDVVVLMDPSDYQNFISEFTENDGVISLESKRSYAASAFKQIAEYDNAINSYFSKNENTDESVLPETINISLTKKTELRYGENPHQQAGLYASSGHQGISLVSAEQLAGKALSYNNYADLDAVLGMILNFDEPFACVVKHSNPCGAATASTLADAYSDALSSDPMSAFGSIIGLNRKVDMATAELLHKTQFIECIIAPAYDHEAVAKMRKKKMRRLLVLPEIGKLPAPDLELKQLRGGFLLQTVDKKSAVVSDLEVVTKVKPTEEQIKAMLFGFKMVKHLKSNAICIVDGTKMVGFGCGQTSRVDAVENAVKKAGTRAKGCVLASDAFFPMPDGVEKAAEAGVTAIIQPGGSKKDADAIAAADAAGIAMVLTGFRHFKH